MKKMNLVINWWQQADFDGNDTFKCEEFVTMSVHMRRLGNDEHLTEAFPTMSTWIR
jgi:hypothetical protein